MKERLKAILDRIKKLSFYRKRKFYIVLAVVFSLLLIADIAVGVLVPTMPAGMMSMQGGGRGEMTFSQDAENDTEAESADEAESTEDSESAGQRGTPPSGEMPEGMSEGEMPEMPEGMTEGEMPEMPEGMTEGEMPEMPEGMTEGEMPEGGMPGMGSTDESDASAAMAGSGSTGMSFLQAWKAKWIVIFVILLILDAASIFMIVWITRKTKKEQEQEIQAIEEQQPDDGEVHIKRKPSGKKHSHYIWIIGLIGMLMLVIVVKVLNAQNKTEASQTEATVYTETAEKGDVNSVVPGTGVLTEEEAEPLELPENVEITKWYVSNGDAVAQGDRLADVDTVSVMSAIVEVQEKLESIDEALEEHENDEISDTIKAATDGRVKVIYAKKNKEVVETIYKSEALMLISLDGKMAVSFEAEKDVSVGDTVKVVLSDGTKKKGKVESVTDGTVVVTVTDKGTDYNESVTVTTSGGKTLGTGNLYIHSELKVTGFTGTVSSVHVAVDEEISSGDKLLTLIDTDYTGEYELLLEKREALEAQIQQLFQLYQDQCIYAECAGVISGLDEDAVKNTDSVGDYIVQFLSEVTDGGSSDSGNADGTDNGSTDDGSTESGETTDDGNTSGGNSSSSDSTTEDSSPATYENYVGVVRSIANGEITVLCYPDAVTNTSVTELKKMESSMTKEKTISASSVNYTCSDGTWKAGGDVKVGDYLVMMHSSKDGIVLVLCLSGIESSTTGNMPSADQTAGNGEANLAGGSASGMPQTSATASQDEMTAAVMESLSEEIEEDYSVSETTWLSITPQDYMNITITIDELDILSLEKGQDAQVTLNAFPGQSFEGTVKSVDITGENSGGSSKYTAVVQIAREENMLAGMNASVKVNIATATDVLCIPVAALVEQDGFTYVYTSYNEKNDELGDLVEVTTGVSDGGNVEILSGLSEGDEYCYSYLDVVNYTSSSSNSGSFSINSLFGGRSGGPGR